MYRTNTLPVCYFIKTYDHDCFGTALLRHISHDADAGCRRNVRALRRRAAGRYRQASGFPGIPIDVEAVTRQVDASLYRNRSNNSFAGD
jgi:hypothetical protein